MADTESERLLVLREESTQVSTWLRGHYAALDRYVGLGLASFAIVAGFAEPTQGFVVAPLIISVITLLALDQLQEIMALSAYHAWLERQINHRLGERLKQWDSWIARDTLIRSRPKIASWVALSLFVLSSGIVSLVFSWSEVRAFGWPAVIAITAYWAVWLVLTAVGGRDAWMVQFAVDRLLDYDPTSISYSYAALRHVIGEPGMRWRRFIRVR